jgi:hypothetical protein
LRYGALVPARRRSPLRVELDALRPLDR